MESGEREPTPETLDTVQLRGRSLQAWHDWLTTDQQTGQDTSHYRTPVSRYGYDSDECAWHAIAAEWAYIGICGEEGATGEAALTSMMGFVVNDDEGIADLIAYGWNEMPECLRDKLYEPQQEPEPEPEDSEFATDDSDFPAGAYVAVEGYKGVAWVVRAASPDWVRAYMVGDRRNFEHPRDDCRRIEREAFCGVCGSVGCQHDGLERESSRLTEAQHRALAGLCLRYSVEFSEDDYQPQFDLPAGWVAGWVGGAAIQEQHPTIYIGCSPEGEVSS